MITYLATKCLKSVGKVKKTDFFSKTRIQTIVVMLKLISLSGYLSFKKIALRLSHSSANRADDDERRRTRFSMVMKRDRFYRASTWLSQWRSRPLFVAFLNTHVFSWLLLFNKRYQKIKLIYFIHVYYFNYCHEAGELHCYSRSVSIVKMKMLSCESLPWLSFKYSEMSHSFKGLVRICIKGLNGV